MKLTFVCGLLVAALGTGGCAVGSSAELADGIARPDPSLPDPEGAAGPVDASPRPSPDAGASAPVDAGPRDAASDADGGATSSCAFSGQLLAFDLTQATGSPADLAASAKAAGVVASPLRRVGVTTVASNQAMNASDWPSGALDVGKHYAFTVTPPAGCALTPVSLTLDLKASPTGPKKAAVGTSVDGFAALPSVPVSAAGGPVVVAFPGATKVGAAVEVRVFGFEAASSAGTLRLEGTLSLLGTLGPL